MLHTLKNMHVILYNLFAFQGSVHPKHYFALRSFECLSACLFTCNVAGPAFVCKVVDLVLHRLIGYLWQHFHYSLSWNPHDIVASLCNFLRLETNQRYLSIFPGSILMGRAGKSMAEWVSVALEKHSPAKFEYFDGQGHSEAWSIKRVVAFRWFDWLPASVS